MKYWQALKQVNYEDVLKRAAWTFIQAFLAVFVFALDSLVDLIFSGDWTQLYTVSIATLIAATAAGFSALKTIVLEYVSKLKEL